MSHPHFPLLFITNIISHLSTERIILAGGKPKRGEGRKKKKKKAIYIATNLSPRSPVDVARHGTSTPLEGNVTDDITSGNVAIPIVYSYMHGWYPNTSFLFQSVASI